MSRVTLSVLPAEVAVTVEVVEPRPTATAADRPTGRRRPADRSLPGQLSLDEQLRAVR